jgi:GGDEF domain-containing protein
VYRIGGDEFAALLPGANARHADRVMSRIAATSDAPFSWGVSTAPADGPSAEGLVAAADRRLYRRRARRRSHA